MRHVFRLLFGLLFLLVSSQAFALVPTAAQYRMYVFFAATGVWHTAIEDACADMLANRVSGAPTYTWSLTTCTWTSVGTVTLTGVPKAGGSNFVGNYGGGLQRQIACPANSVAVSGGCQCAASFDESAGQCVPHVNQCTSKTGVVGILSWTEGYTRTPDEGDRQAVGPVASPPSSGEVCDAGCKVSLQMSGPGVQPFVSQSPTANGLYRRSVDYPKLGLGTECTGAAADAGAVPTTPAPECPGSVGEVGGKVVCVGTASKPVSTVPLGQPSGPAIAGNPPAGGKPPSGEGSGNGSAGRTPASGNGTGTGGPAAAGVGGAGGAAGGTRTGGGSGTSAAPAAGEQPTPCGAPGQPICSVRVDETGTPSGVGTTFDAATAQLEANKASTEAAINAAHSIAAPTWSFTFALPTGCTPYPMEIKGFVLNPCPYQGTIHDLMSMIWAAVTFFTITGMVGRTIRGA
jgi:hypothetical protein